MFKSRKICTNLQKNWSCDIWMCNHQKQIVKVSDHWLNCQTTELIKKKQQNEKNIGIKATMRAIGTSWLISDTSALVRLVGLEKQIVSAVPCRRQRSKLIQMFSLAKVFSSAAPPDTAPLFIRAWSLPQEGGQRSATFRLQFGCDPACDAQAWSFKVDANAAQQFKFFHMYFWLDDWSGFCSRK